MEKLVDALAEYRGRRVLITGDTGFKGSWLSLWLQQRGASVFGYALPPESNSHFNALGLNKLIEHQDGDVRDFKSLSTYINEINPEIIFHLAAQALVIESYRDPKSTSDTNIGGSINILEAVRLNPNTKQSHYDQKLRSTSLSATKLVSAQRGSLVSEYHLRHLEFAFRIHHKESQFSSCCTLFLERFI